MQAFIDAIVQMAFSWLLELPERMRDARRQRRS